MSAPAPTTLSSFALRAIELGVARGLDAAALAEAGGVSIEELSAQGARVPSRTLYSLYAYLLRELDDVAVPLRVAELTSMEDLYVMGFAVMTAPDGREATRRAVRFAGLIGDDLRWSLIEAEHTATVRSFRDGPLTLGRRAATEAALADFVHGVRALLGDDVPVVRIAFRHPAPPDVEPHRAFFRCPVEFGAAHDEFELPIEIYSRAPRDANPALAAYFADHAEALLRERDVVRSVAARVRQAIADELASGEPTLGRIARRLAMSERSLRRRLAAEGTRFGEQLVQVRHARARALLRRPELSLSEIAYLLGFSNVSAFSRAFKKWAGVSPGEHRASSR